MTGVVLALGSNRCFRELSPVQVLTRACTMLSVFLENLCVSGVYRTKAMYVTDQPDFFNAAAYGMFNGTARELLWRIHGVERVLGRNRSREIRNGPRSLDIDIELFGSEVINTKTLVIPHPRMEERAFVLAPLLDILEESADVSNKGIGFYEKRLSELRSQGVENVLSKEAFRSLCRLDAESFTH